MDQTTAEEIAATNPSAVDPYALALCPPLDDDADTGLYPILDPATDTDIQFEYDTLGADSPTLDVYRPLWEGGTELPTYPAMILVHGGGFSRGCNNHIQREAAVAAGVSRDPDPKVPNHLSQKFLVFNINYRMACPDSDTDIPNEIFCGGYFSTADSSPYDAVDYSPGVHDVEVAVSWVQAHAGEYCPWKPGWEYPCWNGKIELVGNSSGGNLAFEAAARLSPKTETNTLQVDAVGSWSGALRLNVLSTGTWPCNHLETSKYKRCQSAEIHYIHCAGAGSTYPPPTACRPYYKDASPDDPVSDANTYGIPYLDPGLPRAYFANGTPDPNSTPTGKKEIISLQSALDFEDDLGTNGWFENGSGDIGAFRFCQVDEDLHAKTYIYTDPDPAAPPAEHHHCSDEADTDSVFEDMVSFLNSAVT